MEFHNSGTFGNSGNYWSSAGGSLSLKGSGIGNSISIAYGNLWELVALEVRYERV
jgi:hypothetical protein